MNTLVEEQPQKHSLLVVDDEEPLLQIFLEFFEGTDYDVTIAKTGEEAIDLLSTRSFDLVVTDLNLPGADGLTVLRKAKETESEIEVIVLTGNASTLTAIDALRQGAYDYVLKPFDLYEMEQTVSKALERRRLLDENRRHVARLQRHRDELERRVEEATLRIRTLYEVGKEISSSLDLENTLSLIVNKSLELIGARQGLLFLVGESDQMECGVSLGFEDDSSEREEVVDALEEINERVLDTHDPSLAPIQSDTLGDRTALVIPLYQENDVTGTIAVLSSGPDAFDEDDQSLLVSLASQASIAIHNAKVYGKIEALDRMKSEFVAVVSHEVRTPLTAIKGTLEILSDAQYFELPESQLELLRICQTNVERLEALINDILDFSKLESSQLSTNFVRTHLDSLVESVLVNLGQLAERNEVQFEKHIDPDLPAIEADELRISQVVGNLISNAVKFSQPGSTIRVRARARDEGVIVQIEDEGIGIAKEDLPKLFTKFRQLDSSSTRKAGGTGLGLAISRGIVDEHGGRIWAESEPNKGSVFSFWLPSRQTEERKEAVRPRVRERTAST